MKSDNRTRAKTAAQIIRQRYDVFPFEGAWRAAFDQPERCGVWLIWGNSGNGKTSFLLQLCKELTRYDRVLYNSLEEADSLTMQRSLIRHHMEEVGSRLHFVCEPMEQIEARLAVRKPPRIIVVDSLQYTQLTYRDYIALKERHRDKLFIFISHADGNKPSGGTAMRVKYDATLKIWVEGYRAHSNGRFVGERGYYTVWDEGAERYWSIDSRSNND